LAEKKLKSNYNSDGLINWLRQPGLLLNQPPKSMRVKFNQLIKSCGTRTDPAAETKSIGLPAGGTPTQLNRRAVSCQVIVQLP